MRNSLVILALLTMLAIAGCSRVPGIGQTKAGAAVPDLDVSDAAIDQVVIEPQLPSPNPYLLSPIPNEQVQQAFAAALELMAAEQWDAAITAFKLVADNNRALSGPWINIGIIRQHQGKLSEAEEAWKNAINSNPSQVESYNLLAALKREQGEFLVAEGLYLDALKIWQDHPNTHCNLGILYDLYMGRQSESLIEYHRCAELMDEPDRQLRGWIADLERRIGPLEQHLEKTPASPLPESSVEIPVVDTAISPTDDTANNSEEN